MSGLGECPTIQVQVIRENFSSFTASVCNLRMQKPWALRTGPSLCALRRLSFDLFQLTVAHYQRYQHCQNSCGCIIPSSFPSFAMSTCIPANPDVSGVGVRSAIYAQNLLTFIPVLISLKDDYVSSHELQSIETQSVAILIIAFSILISTIIQVKTQDFSNFHTALILNLSWMNNTSTFIWFLLYVHRRTKPYPTMPVTWDDWMERAKSLLRPRPSMANPDAHAIALLVSHQTTKRTVEGSQSEYAEKHSPEHSYLDEGVDKVTSKPGIIRRLSQRTAGNLVLILGSIHLSLMSALGIWLWRSPLDFGSSSARCQVSLVVLGQSVPFDSPGLRRWSLILYWIFAIPGLNLVLPFIFFLIPHIIENQVRKWRSERRVRYNKLGFSEISVQFRKEGHTATLKWLGLGSLLCINLIFLVDTEATISRNRASHNGGEERQMGYGQVLSLVLLLVPLRDVFISLAFSKRSDSKKATKCLRQALVDGALDTEQVNRWLAEDADYNSIIIYDRKF